MFTLKTLLNGKVVCHFFPGIPIILADTKSTCEIKNLEANMNIFIRSFRNPRKMANDRHGACDPQVENHCFKTNVVAARNELLITNDTFRKE